MIRGYGWGKGKFKIIVIVWVIPMHIITDIYGFVYGLWLSLPITLISKT